MIKREWINWIHTHYLCLAIYEIGTHFDNTFPFWYVLIIILNYEVNLMITWIIYWWTLLKSINTQYVFTKQLCFRSPIVINKYTVKDSYTEDFFLISWNKLHTICTSWYSSHTLIGGHWVLLHFLFEQIACVVFLLEDVSFHGLWNIRDAAEKMSVSFQTLRKCWLGFIDASASSSLSGTFCHRCSVSCSAHGRKLSWGSIFIEWYCYIWLNLHIT